MSELSEATAATKELVCGDKTYQLSPLHMADWGEFDNWMSSVVILRASLAAQGVEDASLRRDVLLAAQSRASSLSIASLLFNLSPQDRDTVRTFLYSPDGVLRVTWYSLRQQHKTLTVEQTRTILDSDDVVPEVVLADVLILSGVLQPRPTETADKTSPPDQETAESQPA